MGAQERSARFRSARLSKEASIDTNTLLIILIVLVVLGGGGVYGRGRWFWGTKQPTRAMAAETKLRRQREATQPLKNYEANTAASRAKMERMRAARLAMVALDKIVTP